jgi:ribosomal protein S18 acetylase RimI-like enzyme
MLLRAMEGRCVSACGRFLIRGESGDPVWTLRGKDGELAGLLINSRSTLIPVLCGREIPFPRFLGGFFLRKRIHSIQGLRGEVVILQEAFEKTTGKQAADIFDYDLMSLDRQPDPKGFLSGPSNLVLRVPRMTDLDEIAPLQAAYEQEEVVPKGSTFSPAASRMNIANIVSRAQVLTAEICGRLVGKINISAVSFTRYQVGGVYVHPDFRGMGIARRMATEFIASLINEGRGVTLFVKKDNLAARRLYTSLGFSVSDDYRITYY